MRNGRLIHPGPPMTTCSMSIRLLVGKNYKGPNLSRSAGCGKYVDETRAYEKSVRYVRQLRLTVSQAGTSVRSGHEMITRVTWPVTSAHRLDTLQWTHISHAAWCRCSHHRRDRHQPRTARPQGTQCKTQHRSATVEANPYTMKRGEFAKTRRSNPEASGIRSRLRRV